MRDTSLDTERITRIWRWIHNNVPGEPSRQDEDIADTVIRLFAANAAVDVKALCEDKARLDWMQEHGASVEVEDDDTLPCEVQASDDFRLRSRVACYDIRAAIDAARTTQEG